MYACLLAITVSFSQVQYNCAEDMDSEDSGATQVQLILSNPSSFDVIVFVVSTNIIAADLSSSKHRVYFPANVTMQTVDILICNDSVLEENETFSLTIASSSHPNNVTNGSPDHTIVTINRECLICG